MVKDIVVVMNEPGHKTQLTFAELIRHTWNKNVIVAGDNMCVFHAHV